MTAEQLFIPATVATIILAYSGLVVELEKAFLELEA